MVINYYDEEEEIKENKTIRGQVYKDENVINIKNDPKLAQISNEARATLC